MRLSEAIRLGSMLHPQCFGVLHTYQAGQLYGVVAASCALGAAEDAGYPDAFESQLGDAVDVQCPICVFEHYLANVIGHLNDWHLWTREAIADWVEQIEHEEEKTQARVDRQPSADVPVPQPATR